MEEYSNEYHISIGERHGILTAISKVEGTRNKWLCKCDCGNEKILYACYFYKLKSCGCLEKKNRELIGERTKKHGGTETILYKKWCGMKARCNNPHYYYYHKYGGRGIKVCNEWNDSFENFKEWALANGYDESKSGRDQTIDRIDVNGDYCPQNCRFVPMYIQSLNTTRSHFIEYKGTDMNISVFADITGVARHYARRHSNKGETGEEIITNWYRLHPELNVGVNI